MGRRKSFKKEVLERLRDLGTDFIVFAAILVSIWAMTSLHHLLWGPQGLVFFEGSALPIKGQWIIDAADMGDLGFFSIRTVWIFARGVIR